MASGDVVVHVLAVMPPGSSYATEDILVGAASPAEGVPVWDFDGGTSLEYIDFLCALEGYDGGGLSPELVWAADAASNNVVWQMAIRALPDDAEDIDTTAHSYQFNTVTGACPSAIGELSYDTITFTDGADMDSWADGQLAIVRVLRDPTHASDSHTGDAMLLGFVGRET